MPAASGPHSFTVAVDTREQLPYELEGVECVKATLETGDYSVVGLESLVAVERKSFADFYLCLTEGRLRFESCLHRLAAIRYPLVVVEASMSDLLKPFIYVAPGGKRTRSRLGPVVAQNSLLSWQARFRIPMLLCGDRKGAARMTLQHLSLVTDMVRDEARWAAATASEPVE